jgi:hypothetical protein
MHHDHDPRHEVRCGRDVGFAAVLRGTRWFERAVLRPVGPAPAALAMALTLLALALVPGAVSAHGSHAPRHGGIIKTTAETSIELVVGPEGAEVYLTEEDEPVPSAGLSGKILVLAGGARTDTPLVPAGANRFAAKGLKIGKGSRVLVQLTLADGVKKVGVNFAIP